MTARKPPARKAPAKAAPRRKPSPLSLSATPAGEPTVEERLSLLEQNYAQLRAEHDQIKAIIHQAIITQVQQHIATDAGAQQALIQQLMGNGELRP